MNRQNDTLRKCHLSVMLFGRRGLALLACYLMWGLLVFSHSASADQTVLNVTLNGQGSVTVEPGETISATVTVLIDGKTSGANGRWYSTRWRIGNGSYSCIDHANFSGAGSHSTALTIIAPATPGTYAASFRAYASNRCGSQNSDTFDMTNAVAVTSVSDEPVAEYHLDESQWTGLSGEVTDSSGNGYDGTAVNATTDIPGQICRAGQFDGNDDYLQVSGLSDLLNGTASLAFWIKTTQTGNNTAWRAPGIAGVEQNGGTDDIFWGWLDAAGRIGVTVGNNNSAKSTVAINNGAWRHVVLTRHAGSGAYKIYIDGVLNKSGTVASGIIGTGYSSLGRIENTNGSPVYFQGELDEVLIFDSVLSDTAVQAGYANQLSGNSWDGSARTCAGTGPLGCQAVFGSPLQNADTSGAITLNWNAQALADPDGTLETRTLNFNTQGVPTCGSAHCTKTDTTSTPANLPDFPANSSTTDLSTPINIGGTLTLGTGGVTHYRTVTVGGWLFQSQLLDSGAADAYYIKTLNLNWNTQSITLRGGTDYWIETLNFNTDLTINVAGQGTARLFVQNAVSASWGTRLNPGGSPDQLLIVPYDGITWNTGPGTAFNALIYSNGNISIGSNMTLSGALASPAQITLGSGSRITYDTGAVNDVDDRGLCPGTAGEALDHILLLHDGQGLTCAAETVTIKACANAACDDLYSGEVTLDLSSPAAGWSADPVIFSGGTADVSLSHTVLGTITLAAATTSPVAANGTECTNSSGGNPCEMTFTDTGILIDGDDSDGTAESLIITQIAGKPSNFGHGAATQRVRVVHTDDATGACVASVGNQTLNATLSYQLPVAGEGLGDNTLSVTGAGSTSLTAAGASQTIPLAFDGNGTAPFSLTSQDAGRYQLRIEMAIPVVDPDGNPTGETVAASDTSNGFVVRPLALFADASGNPRAQNAAGAVFAGAGEGFTLSYKSLRWSAARDGDNDGLWDDCASPTLVDPTLADPGVYARVPAWTIGQAGADLQQPAGGNAGTLTHGAGDAAFSAAASTTNEGDVAYSEVGIIQLQQAGLNPFLGESVTLCSPYIGRFTPADFTLTITDQGALENSCPAGGFSYTGSPIGYLAGRAPKATITARNGSGATTLNYTGAYKKLFPTDISMLEITEDGTQLGADGLNRVRLSWTPGLPSLTDNGDGSLDFALNGDVFIYDRTANALVAPFTSDIDLTVQAITDADGVGGSGLPQDFSPAGVELRFGRMAMQNAQGSQLLPLYIPMQEEYYASYASAASGFVANPDPLCTDNLTLSLSGESGSVIATGINRNTAIYAPATVAVGFAASDLSDTSLLFVQPPSAGDFNLNLQPPGADNVGSVIVEVDVPDWLGYQWTTGNLKEDPTAKATFGIFSRPSQLIYQRETY